jgi:DNA-directed RNA polymerase subunit RPC12/RpoP
MDLPINERVKRGNAALAMHPGAQIFYKFTCAKCGSRQTFSEPNTLYPWGDCEECGSRTEVTEGGFDLYLKLGKDGIYTPAPPG